MKNKKIKILCFTLIILTAFIIRVFGLDKTGLIAGEEFWLLRGESLISHLSRGDIKNSTADFERHPGIPAAFLIGLSMKYLGLEDKKPNEFFPDPSFYSLYSLKIFDPLSAARLPIIIFGTLSAALLFWFVLRIFKNLSLATISGLILALDPFHIGLSRMAHQDIVLSFFFMASLFLYFLGEKEKKNKFKVLAGVFFGLALLTKIVAILIPLIILVWKLGRLFKKTGEKIISRKMPFDLVDFSVFFLGILIFFVFYPTLWQNTGENLIRHINLNIGKNTAFESYSFFGKNLKETNYLFYLVAIPVRMTFISLIGLVFGIFLWIKRKANHKTAFSLFLIWLLIVILVMSSAGKLKDRYISPIWPLLSFFSAYGIYFLAKKFLKKYAFLTSAILVISFALPGIFYFYPNYLFFFNLPTNLLYGGFNIIDSSASICLKEAAKKLNEIPDIEQKTVLAPFGPGFEPYFRGKTIAWDSRKNNSRNYPSSDLVVLNIHDLSRHSPQTLYRIFKDKEPIYKIKANGLECAFIYKNER